MPKNHILHVAVDRATNRELRKRAELTDLSLSDILRQAISAYLTPERHALPIPPAQHKQGEAPTA